MKILKINIVWKWKLLSIILCFIFPLMYSTLEVFLQSFLGLAEIGSSQKLLSFLTLLQSIFPFSFFITKTY